MECCAVLCFLFTILQSLLCLPPFADTRMYRYYPDEQLTQDGRGYDEEYLKALSALRVRIPSVGFGSR